LNKIIGKILNNKDTGILKYIGGKLYKQNCDDFINRYSNDPILKDKSYADLFDNNSDITDFKWIYNQFENGGC
jgi:hypothetical protein